jgi:hypothetical protein
MTQKSDPTISAVALLDILNPKTCLTGLILFKICDVAAMTVIHNNV